MRDRAAGNPPVTDGPVSVHPRTRAATYTAPMTDHEHELERQIEEQHVQHEAHEAWVKKVSVRALLIVIGAMLVVVAALTISTVVATSSARDAQSLADRQIRLNEQLSEDIRAEATCRSILATEFDLVTGDILANIGDALVLLQAGQPLDEAVAQVSALTAELRARGAERRAGGETCIVTTPGVPPRGSVPTTVPATLPD